MIGKNIYKLRKERGLTLSELAEKALISKSYLSNIERNLNTNPSIQVMEKIAKVLKVDLHKLINPKCELDLSAQTLEKEWGDVIQVLKEKGINKENIQDYKILLDFIRWHQANKN